ncbi:MAG: CaiB/BaiF CoA-transferase family protein [Pseudomonadota bacterium]
MGLDRELDGILVVSLEQAVAAPYCGLLLRDAGARVIKVERPDGDFARGYDKGAGGRSSFFAWLNRGKESISLDLNQPEDEALLRSLLRKADVFLHNLAPGALQRRGFGYAALAAENPGLISCELSGYGRSGAASGKKAYDFLVQGEAGICAVTGTEDQPARVGVSITDISTGLTAFSSILRALIQRGRTGEGMELTLSMFDVMADWMNMPLLDYRYVGRHPRRMALTHPHIAPYGAFSTADDSQVLISVQNDREWVSLCENVLAKPELGTDPRFLHNPDRIGNREAVEAELNAVFGKYTRTELMTKLQAAKIACSQLSTVEDLSEHELLRNLTVRYAETELAVADLPVQIDGERARDVPLLDQHGAAIRAEFGG